MKNILSLQGAILIFSTSGIFSKKASMFPIMSRGFIFCFGISVLIMGIYAILWQRILKNTSLSVAYANKGILPLLSIIWGSILFDEQITLNMIFGVLIIIGGIILVVTDDV